MRDSTETESFPQHVVSRLTDEAAQAARWLRLGGLVGILMGIWGILAGAMLVIGAAMDVITGVSPAVRDGLSPAVALPVGTVWLGVGLTAYMAGRSLLTCSQALRQYRTTPATASLTLAIDRYRLFLKTAIVLVTFTVLYAGGWLVTALVR